MKTDWLGNTYDIGDLVLYAAMSGRSVTMVLAEVVKFNESGSVGLKPVRSARWKQHYGKSYNIDNRTGKRIDPWSGDGKHIEVEAYFKSKQDPSKTLSFEEYHKLPYREMDKWEYVPTQFKDYVEHRHKDTKIVTISVTENIVKWLGELPEETQDDSSI